jgi:uncharacterized protein YjeT (DUF2065 family)
LWKKKNGCRSAIRQRTFFGWSLSIALCGLPGVQLSGIAGVMKLLVTLIGLVLILEGLPYLASPETMQNWLRHIAAMEPSRLRRIGLVAMAAGFLLCFLAQRTLLFG